MKEFLSASAADERARGSSSLPASCPPSAPTYCGLDRYTVHEAGHVTGAELRGFEVAFARRDSHGGMTGVHFDGADPKAALLVHLAGFEGTRLFFGTAEAEGSRVDFEAAYRIAFDLARDEEHAADAEKTGSAGPAPVSQKLTAFSEADIGAGFARLVARRTARAHVLVNEARAEVRELLEAHKCVVRTLAVALERYRYLDADAVRALLEEGRRRQAKDDEQWRKSE